MIRKFILKIGRQIRSQLSRKKLIALSGIITLSVIVAMAIRTKDTHWEPTPLEKFVIKTEAKYRRDESQDEIAVHFTLRLPNTVVVSISSLVTSDAMTVRSIGEAADELLARLIVEDKDLKGQINHELEYKTRTQEKKEEKTE